MTNEIVTLIFSGVVAISTIAYVVLTGKLVKETKLSREFFLDSQIIAYIVNFEASPSIVSLVIKNIGKGVAKNVRFQIIKDIEYRNSNSLNKIGIFNDGIKVFPPNHQYKFILMSLTGDPKKIEDNIAFTIEYDDALNKKNKETFDLRFMEIEGLSNLTPPGTYIGRISYRLEKIEKILEKYLKNPD